VSKYRQSLIIKIYPKTFIVKQLLLNPLILILLALIVLIYIALAFNSINGNVKWSKQFEKICITLFLMNVGGVNIGPTYKFHPTVLINDQTSLTTLVMVISVYVIIFILLCSRISLFLKEIVSILWIAFYKNLAFFVYLIIIILSFAFSATPGHTFKASLVFLGVTLILLYAGKHYSWEELYNILIWYHVIGLIFSLLFGNKGDHWTGVWSHKNVFASQMALSTILMYLQSVNLRKYKWLFILLSALSVFCVQQAGSGMGKALIVILIILIWFLRFLKRLPPRIAFACLGIFLAIGIYLSILVSENAEYIIVEKLGKSMTLTGRTLFWPLIVEAINKRPFFGYGYLGFWKPSPNPEDPSFPIISPDNGFRPEHSHNGFLDVGVDFGWGGLLLFIISIIINIYYGILYLNRCKKNYLVGLPLIIFTQILIFNFTETSLLNISSGWSFYVLMTARLASEMTEDRSSENPKLQKSFYLESG